MKMLKKNKTKPNKKTKHQIVWVGPLLLLTMLNPHLFFGSAKRLLYNNPLNQMDTKQPVVCFMSPSDRMLWIVSRKTSGNEARFPMQFPWQLAAGPCMSRTSDLSSEEINTSESCGMFTAPRLSGDHVLEKDF